MPESRYEGKPMLRLIELYVLSAIGHLKDSDRVALEGMAPTLRRTLAPGNSWDEIVSAQMEFSIGMSDAVRSNWERWQKHREGRGEPIDPEIFARVFADQLFEV